MRPELTIAILTYNRWQELLPRCLLPFMQVTRLAPTWDILVVDHGAQVPVTGLPPHMRVHRAASNRGVTAGENCCFQEARGQWVLFVSDDVLVPDLKTVEGLLQAAQAASLGPTPLGIVQPVVRCADGSIDQAGVEWVWPGYGWARKRYVTRETPIVTSACYLLRRAVWEALGGLNETAFPHCYEDVEFSLRLGDVGYTHLVIREAEVTHLIHQTYGDLSGAYRTARRDLIQMRYRGLDQWTRLAALRCLDAVRSGRMCNRARNHSTPGTGGSRCTTRSRSRHTPGI